MPVYDRISIITFFGVFMWFIFKHLVFPLAVDVVWGIGLERAFGIDATLWFLPVPFVINFFPLGHFLNFILFALGIAQLMAENGLLY